MADTPSPPSAVVATHDAASEATRNNTPPTSAMPTEDDEKAAAPLSAAPAPSAAPSPAEAGKRTPLQTLVLMAALCMSVFLAALDITIITTALPTIAQDFGSSAGFVWVGSAFNLGVAAAAANWGKFSDVWGRKPVLLTANATFVLGCALCGAAPSVAVLIAGRAVQGVGAGGLLTLVYIIIGDLFSARERGKYYGIIGMVWATASALGPIVGGALTNSVSWRWCFYINLPISGTAFFIVLVILKLPSPKTPLLAGLRAIDWLGTLAITGGVLMLLMGLQFGGTSHPWRSATVVCLIVFGAVLVVLFGVVEHAVATYPVVPTHVFASRTSRAVLALALFHGLSFILLFYFLPTYFQSLLGATPLLSGVWLLAASLAVSAAASFSGGYLARTGRYRDLIVAGFLLGTLGVGLMCDLPHSRGSPSAASAWARIVVFQLFAGAGLGLNFQPPLIALQAHVHAQDNAAATASFQLVRSVAYAAGVVAGSAVFAGRMTARHDVILAALRADPATAGTADATAAALTGGNAQANLFLVDTLPPAAKQVVRAALYEAQRNVWIMATCFAAAGLVASLFVQTKTLQTTHEVVQTGIEGEKERRRIALRARAARKKTTDQPAAEPVAAEV